MPSMGQRVQKMWKEKPLCRINANLTDPRVGTTIGSQNQNKSQNQCNRSQDHNKEFHEVDRDDGFDDWYGAAAY